jgi:Cytochrome c554 and c-prime
MPLADATRAMSRHLISSKSRITTTTALAAILAPLALQACGDDGPPLRHLQGSGPFGDPGASPSDASAPAPPAAPPPSSSSPPPAPPPSPNGDAGGAPPAHSPFASSASCGACHTTIYQQWSQSMHSRALTTPTTVVQNNQVTTGSFAGQPSPDPLRFCVNCHSPTAASISTSASLPLDSSTGSGEGVSCTGCHQFNGSNEIGSGGNSTQFQAGFVAGSTYFGPISDPVGNSFHQSTQGNAYQIADDLCANCHDVNIDLDHDGRIVKGFDLVLQTTYDEFQDYLRAGGQQGCVSCHMPALTGLTRAADGASIPSQQFTDAPPRTVHDHSFVGVDYALDDATQTSAQQNERQSQLENAGAIQIDRNSISVGNGSISFNVLVANNGAGHNLPTGFAFSRQMWLEIKVTDTLGNVLFSSGLLTDPTQDLCDPSTLNEAFNPMIQYVQGCLVADPQLVNFQAKLVDKVAFQFDNNGNIIVDGDGQPILQEDPFGGHETWLQYLKGGVVARQRGIDQSNLAPLAPFEQRTFNYQAQVSTQNPLQVSVRLLFRNLPPYFMRALGRNEPSGSSPQEEPLVSSLQIVQMATDEVSLQ